MRNLENYDTLELNAKEINGGTFGYDAGWLLGNLIAGKFMSYAGQADAIMKYAVHLCY